MKMFGDSVDEEILVYIDFNTKMDDDNFSPDKEIKITGLAEEKPILQMGNQIFQGEWRDSLGTHLFFEENKNPPKYDPIFSEVPEKPVKYSFKTEKILYMSRVFLNTKNTSSDSPEVTSRPDSNENADQYELTL